MMDTFTTPPPPEKDGRMFWIKHDEIDDDTMDVIEWHDKGDRRGTALVALKTS